MESFDSTGRDVTQMCTYNTYDLRAFTLVCTWSFTVVTFRKNTIANTMSTCAVLVPSRFVDVDLPKSLLFLVYSTVINKMMQMFICNDTSRNEKGRSGFKTSRIDWF